MWLYRCIFILLPYIVNCLQDNVQVRPRSEDSELVFTDVIKNISRVNNVLEELINNYEQLKKLYKSQEDSNTGESDTEIDEVFKAKERGKNKSKTTGKPLSMGEFPATQMFWSDDEKNSNSASNVANEKGKSSKKVAAIKDTAKKSSENSSSSQSTADSSDTSSETDKKNSKTKETKPALRKKPKIVFIDTYKTTKKTAEVKQNKMESIYKTTNKSIDPEITNVEDKTKNSTIKVHKVVHAESFSKKNIWNEIFNNKPIQLQKSHIVYDLAREPDNGTKHAKLRSSDSIPKGVQVINNNENIKDNADANFDQTEDEVVVKKEQFKTDVLRTAYGDACLKLVVTKCNKACKAVRKSVCRKYHCKSDFNDKYKSATWKGCRKEFSAVDTEKASTKKQYNYRGEQDEQESDDFIDPTRSGYISGACLSPSQDKVEPPKVASLRNGTRTSSETTFNILRDRYEEACKKVSVGKCKKACFFAYEAACQGSCNSAKIKAFKKSCKNECASAYRLRDTDSDSD